MRKYSPCLMLVLAACTGNLPEQAASGPGDPYAPAAVRPPQDGERHDAMADRSQPISPVCPAGELLRQQMLAAVNLARSRARTCGEMAMPATLALEWSEPLTLAAYRHSADMAKSGIVSHIGSNGSSVAGRVSAQGYKWRWIGENLAAGQTGVEPVVAGWLESPDHCRNIMNGGFSHMGGACVENSGSLYRCYWTLVLGQPQSGGKQP